MLSLLLSFVFSYELNIDMGSFFTKASSFLYSEPPSMSVNMQTKRLTPTFLGFKVPKKLNGTISQKLTTKQLKKLIAVHGENALQYIKSRPHFCSGFFPIFADRDDETSRELAKSLLVDHSILQIENHDLISFFLKLFIDSVTEGRPLKHVNFVFPASFTIPQRHYIEQAARIAGFPAGYSCDDVEAIISLYSVTRAYSFTKAGKTVLFIDVGATSTKAYCVSFRTRDGKRVEAERYNYQIDETIGGSFVTVKLSKILLEKYGIDDPTETEERKFFDAAEKMKKQLALLNFTHAVVEDIRGKNLNLTFTRDELDKATEIFRRKVIQVARNAANGIQIDDIEVIGGGHRIQSLQIALQNEFNMNISHTVNADEGLAIGCGFAAQFHGEFSNFLPPTIISEHGQYSVAMTTTAGLQPVCIKNNVCREELSFPSPAKLFQFTYKESELSKGLMTDSFADHVSYPDCENITIKLSITPFYVKDATYCTEDKCMPAIVQRYTPAPFNFSTVVEALISGEKLHQQAAKAHNDLELLAIKSLNFIKNETVILFTNEEQREEISNYSQNIQKWLFDSPRAPVKQVKERNKNLRKLTDAVEKRIRENSTQFQAMENFMRTFAIIESSFDSWKVEKPWIPQAAIDKLRASYEEKKKWFDEEVDLISNSPLWVDRRVTAHDFDKRGKKLYQEYLNVSSIRNPELGTNNEL